MRFRKNLTFSGSYQRRYGAVARNFLQSLAFAHRHAGLAGLLCAPIAHPDLASLAPKLDSADRLKRPSVEFAKTGKRDGLRLALGSVGAWHIYPCRHGPSRNGARRLPLVSRPPSRTPSPMSD